jgi:hypothetical protein
MPALREENRQVALILQNLLGTSPIYPTGVNLTNAHALHVALVDTNGDQVASFGGGTQYADGATRGTATGTLLMVDDGTLIQSLSGDSTGKLNINNISGTITLPTLAATSTKQSDGSQKTQLVDGSGNVIGATTNALDINIKSGNPTTLTTVSTVTNLAQMNGAAITMGSGINGTGVQRVNLATDQAALSVAGVFSVKLDQTTPGTTNAVSLAQIGGTTIVNGGTAGSQSVGGIVANNGTINSAVNPILVGGQAVSSENAANTTAKLSQLVTDLVGKLIVLPYANPENFVSGAITSAMTGTTSTSLIAAPAAGLRNYITTIIVSNAHATVGTDIVIQDGSGGTTLLTIPAAAVYGGAVITLPTPLRQPTTATAIFCANVTTGASTKVSAVGYKGI